MTQRKTVLCHPRNRADSVNVPCTSCIQKLITMTKIIPSHKLSKDDIISAAM